MIESVDPNTGSVIACVINNRPVIHIMNLLPDNGSDSAIEACMGINLIHETAHTLGLDDRYTDAAHTGTGFQCVMEYYTADAAAISFYSDLKNGLKDPLQLRPRIKL